MFLLMATVKECYMDCVKKCARVQERPDLWEHIIVSCLQFAVSAQQQRRET